MAWLTISSPRQKSKSKRRHSSDLESQKKQVGAGQLMSSSSHLYEEDNGHKLSGSFAPYSICVLSTMRSKDR